VGTVTVTRITLGTVAPHRSLGGGRRWLQNEEKAPEGSQGLLTPHGDVCLSPARHLLVKQLGIVTPVDHKDGRLPNYFK
jgi:hypothetical protein